MKLKNTANDDIEFGTDIMSVEVPEKLRHKFKTGLEYIDKCLGGQGFTPSMVTLFTGEPGSGKTTMMLALADSITKSGGIAVFNTAEESLFQVKLVAERLKLKNGFKTGSESDINILMEKCHNLMARPENKAKQFFLILDSLQCMDDGKYPSGMITSGTAVRCLQMVTDFCKETHACAIVINQVNKEGKMAGSQKLKHMCDSMMHLGVEKKDDELKGCRILETYKNRFGGCGHIFFLALRKTGFRKVAQVSA
jgi:DNA repair protein RadA/Sms